MSTREGDTSLFVPHEQSVSDHLIDGKVVRSFWELRQEVYFLLFLLLCVSTCVTAIFRFYCLNYLNAVYTNAVGYCKCNFGYFQ